jgi:hypothetical protein
MDMCLDDIGKMVTIVMLNATFNNISVISWRSVLLVEETEYPQKITDLWQVNDKRQDLDVQHHMLWGFIGVQ